MIILNKIKDRIGTLEGDIGIYYVDLRTNAGCFAGNADVFPSVGIAKFLVLIEVFKQVEDGALDLEGNYVWRRNPPFAIPEREYEQTVGVLDFLHDGSQLTIRDLVMLMTVVSDNSAFNILLDLVGIDRVNKTLESLSLKKTRIHGLLFDSDGQEQRIRNEHSVKEVGELLVRLYKRQLISGTASEEMLRIMKYHQRRSIIPYFSEGNFSVAHQTGFDKYAVHDAGVILVENPFVLCMSANHTNTGKAESIMRDVAYLCYEHSRK